MLIDALGHRFLLKDALGHRFMLNDALGHRFMLDDALGHRFRLLYLQKLFKTVVLYSGRNLLR